MRAQGLTAKVALLLRVAGFPKYEGGNPVDYEDTPHDPVVSVSELTGIKRGAFRAESGPSNKWPAKLMLYSCHERAASNNRVCRKDTTYRQV